MKVLASSAALFIWLQSAICGLGAVTPASQSDARSHEYQHQQPADANPIGTHRHAGTTHSDDTGSPSGSEDHCDLVAWTLLSASPTVAPPSSVTLLASSSLPTAGVPTVSPSARRFVRAPPRAPDLILQNATFLL